MIGGVVRGSGGLLVLFTLLLGAIIGQPRPADADLQAFLLAPHGCAAPCWLGIRPGVTTMDEALQILKAHPWVKRVVVLDRHLAHYVYWEWSDQAPAYVYDPARQSPPMLGVAGGVIQYISLMTGLSFGEVWALWGQPEGGGFNVINNSSPLMTLISRPNTVHAAVYFGGQVFVQTQVFCPITPRVFWDAPVSIIFYNGDTAPSTYHHSYPLGDWYYSQPCAD